MDRTRRHLRLAILYIPLLTLPVGCATTVSQAQIDCPAESSIGERSGIAVAAAPRRQLRLDATLAPESALDLGSLVIAESLGAYRVRAAPCASRLAQSIRDLAPASLGPDRWLVPLGSGCKSSVSR